MACPFFFPLVRLEDGQWQVPPRQPLGGTFGGECRALPETVTPDDPTLGDFCNRGYGRGHCHHFPSRDGADAVRFHVAGETAESLHIQYVFEKECWPLRHGTLIFEGAVCQSAFRPGEDAILVRQAGAFVESYLGCLAT